MRLPEAIPTVWVLAGVLAILLVVVGAIAGVMLFNSNGEGQQFVLEGSEAPRISSSVTPSSTATQTNLPPDQAVATAKTTEPTTEALTPTIAPLPTLPPAPPTLQATLPPSLPTPSAPTPTTPASVVPQFNDCVERWAAGETLETKQGMFPGAWTSYDDTLLSGYKAYDQENCVAIGDRLAQTDGIAHCELLLSAASDYSLKLSIFPGLQSDYFPPRALSEMDAYISTAGC